MEGVDGQIEREGEIGVKLFKENDKGGTWEAQPPTTADGRKIERGGKWEHSNDDKPENKAKKRKYPWREIKYKKVWEGLPDVAFSRIYHSDVILTPQTQPHLSLLGLIKYSTSSH